MNFASASILAAAIVVTGGLIAHAQTQTMATSIEPNAVVAFVQKECPRGQWEKLAQSDGMYLVGASAKLEVGKSKRTALKLEPRHLPETDANLPLRTARSIDKHPFFDGAQMELAVTKIENGVDKGKFGSETLHIKVGNAKNDAIDWNPPSIAVTFCRRVG